MLVGREIQGRLRKNNHPQGVGMRWMYGRKRPQPGFCQSFSLLGREAEKNDRKKKRTTQEWEKWPDKGRGQWETGGPSLQGVFRSGRKIVTNHWLSWGGEGSLDRVRDKGTRVKKRLDYLWRFSTRRRLLCAKAEKYCAQVRRG